MSITPPGPTEGPTEDSNVSSANATPSKQPKKKGFLSFLNCCGVPDHAHTLESNEGTLPANKVTKVSTGRPVTASRPEHIGPIPPTNTASKTEKEALQTSEGNLERRGAEPNNQSHSRLNPTVAANGELVRQPSSARDAPLPDLPKQAEATAQTGQSNPSVFVQDPSGTDYESSPPTFDVASGQKDAEGDVRMQESEAIPAEKEEIPSETPRKEDTATKSILPPPPPVPQASSTNQSDETISPEPTDQKQQWLLPPIAPRFIGKKCLVLDLDETLVHSSFKVSIEAAHKSTSNKLSRFYTKQTSRSLLRLRVNIITSM